MGACLLLGWGAVAAAAPANQPIVDGLLALGPPLVDLGEMSVGDVRVATLRVDHVEGVAVEVQDVRVVNVEGAAFAYDGDDRFEVPADGVVPLPFTATPLEAGPAYAVAEVTDNGRKQSYKADMRVMVRGGCLAGLPSTVDLGPVAAGETVDRVYEVWGCDGGAVTIDQVTHGGVRLEVSLVDPQRIGGVPQPLILRFVVVDEDALAGQVRLYGPGYEELGRFDVIANDCPIGDPRLWDDDGDGVVDCNQWENASAFVDRDGDGVWLADGDCDDADPTVYPGAPELDGGVDEDCDGLVDEHLDLDRDGVPVPDDCDDGNPWIRPDGHEMCDGLDNDCDGEVDPGCVDAVEIASRDRCGCAASPVHGAPAAALVLLAGLARGRRRRG